MLIYLQVTSRPLISCRKKQFYHLVTSRQPIWQLAFWIVISLELRGPWNGGPFRNARTEQEGALCGALLDLFLWLQPNSNPHPLLRTRKLLNLRVRPPGIEWKTGRNPKMGKNWPKNRNGPRPEMGKKWPKNGEKIGFGVIFYFFAIFGPFFPHFGPRAIFYFSANFFPFLDFGPFSILYQAAWLAILNRFWSLQKDERIYLMLGFLGISEFS